MATLVLAMLGACFYAQDTLVEDLQPGDITGVTVGTPPGSIREQPLAGARVKLRGRSRAVATRSDGRFTLRNLPEGDHRLTFTFDPDNDGVPDLGRVVETPIRIPQGRNRKPWVDLGNVVLLPPGSLAGSVAEPPEANAADVFVALVDEDVRVQLDATRAFQLDRLGEGPWQVVAVQSGRVSNAGRADVRSLQVADVGTLTWPDARESGLLTVTVDGASGVGVEVRAELVDGAAGDTQVFSGTDSASQLIPAGLYTVRVDLGAAYLPARFSNVLVVPPAGATLLVTPEGVPSGACVDLDQDGFCTPSLDDLQASNSVCLLQCREPARDLDVPCTDGAVQVDCDDDGDGQADADERLGSVAGRRPCRCTTYGWDPAVTTCDGDPSRYDLDDDGICDADEVMPPRGNGSSSSSSSSSSSGGTSSASGATSMASSSSAASSAGGSASSEAATSAGTSSGASSSTSAGTSSAPSSVTSSSTSPGTSSVTSSGVSSSSSVGPVSAATSLDVRSSSGVAPVPEPGIQARWLQVPGSAAFTASPVLTPLSGAWSHAAAGLEWSAPSGNTAGTWLDAHAACAALGQGWRLPTVAEAVLVMDHASADVLPAGLFPGADLPPLWTDQARPPMRQSYWVVDPAVGGVPRLVAPASQARVLCARRP